MLLNVPLVYLFIITVLMDLICFPMQVLHAILVARFGSRPAGHWVVMQAYIEEVDVFAMADAWAQMGVAYIMSSCGKKTVAHEQPYISKYEDEYGDVKYKEMLCLAIAHIHMLYEFPPIIDEHNKARQNVLALEKVWMTKNPWNRLVISFAGMGVVDLQRWDQRMRQSYAAGGPVLDYIVTTMKTRFRCLTTT